MCDNKNSKKIKIEFGVMSSRYKLECDNLINGKMAMVLFFQQNLPIAIYKPKDEAFSPKTFLESNPQVNNESVRKAYKSIKKLL
jgi:hypothetical protein